MSRFWLLTLSVLALLGVWLFFNFTPLLQSYASLFVKNNATKGADAIIVLGGNPVERTRKAINLYQQKYGTKILFTTPIESNRFEYPFEWKTSHVYRYLMDEQKLSSFDFIPSLKGGATSTYDEAYDLLAYLDEHPLKHVILVTGESHSARAHYAFSKILNLHGLSEKIKLEASAASDPRCSHRNWWTCESGLNAYISEGFKFLLYWWMSRNLTMVEES